MSISVSRAARTISSSRLEFGGDFTPPLTTATPQTITDPLHTLSLRKTVYC
jgi:hypothetical protein